MLLAEELDSTRDDFAIQSTRSDQAPCEMILAVVAVRAQARRDAKMARFRAVTPWRVQLPSKSIFSARQEEEIVIYSTAQSE